jgi:hypothetical protein
MNRKPLQSSFYDYFYLQQSEHPGNLRYSFSISFEIPLEPQYSSSFQIGIMGLVKNEKIENFELYLTFWSLDNERIQPHLEAQEITSINLDGFKAIQHHKVKINSDIDFTDFFSSTCQEVIKPYIQGLGFECNDYLKDFDDKILRFTKQISKRDIDSIWGENQCSLGSIHLLVEALKNNEKIKMFNHLDNDLIEKPKVKSKKI